MAKIERTYHRRRRQAALRRLTLIAYESVITNPCQLSGLPTRQTCHQIVQQSQQISRAGSINGSRQTTRSPPQRRNNCRPDMYSHPKLPVGWLQRAQTPLETSV